MILVPVLMRLYGPLMLIYLLQLLLLFIYAWWKWISPEFSWNTEELRKQAVQSRGVTLVHIGSGAWDAAAWIRLKVFGAEVYLQSSVATGPRLNTARCCYVMCNPLHGSREAHGDTFECRAVISWLDHVNTRSEHACINTVPFTGCNYNMWQWKGGAQRGVSMRGRRLFVCMKHAHDLVVFHLVHMHGATFDDTMRNRRGGRVR